MFAVARRRVRPRGAQQLKMKQRRRVKTVTSAIASTLHEELSSALSPLQLLRLEREFQALDVDGLGYIHVKDLLSVSWWRRGARAPAGWAAHCPVFTDLPPCVRCRCSRGCRTCRPPRRNWRTLLAPSMQMVWAWCRGAGAAVTRVPLPPPAGNNLIDFPEFLSLLAIRSQHRHTGREVLEAFKVCVARGGRGASCTSPDCCYPCRSCLTRATLG